MDYRSALGSENGASPGKVVAIIDPHHYIRQADLALLDGNRAEAEMSITLAYLAFDLLPADCE